MFQAQFTVRGLTYADLDFKMTQAVNGFLSGSPEGTTATLDTVGMATRVDDQPAGFDPNTQKVISLPVYELTNRYNVGVA